MHRSAHRHISGTHIEYGSLALATAVASFLNTLQGVSFLLRVRRTKSRGVQYVITLMRPQ